MTDISRALQCAQQIEELDAKATPGEWSIEMAGDGSEYNLEKWPQALHGPRSTMQWSDPVAIENFGNCITSIDELNDCDAKLIAHYRSLAPEAAKHIRELTEQIQDLKQEIARHHKDFERWEAMAEKGASQIERIKGLEAENHELRKQTI